MDHILTKTGRARVDEMRTEKTEKKKKIRQTRPVVIQYAAVRTKKDGTALLHSTNTPPTISRKYAFTVFLV